MNEHVLRKLINMALILALGVVMLGAYTRLTDAGLGCPDWPGCYGHLVLPSQEHALENAQQLYPEVPIEQTKAWTEMAHRYLAGSLLGFIVIILGILTFNTKFKGLVRPIYLIAVLALLLFQALLGMWTVTLKLLPTVVMGHLLGGFSIFSVLTVLRCYFLEKKPLGLVKWRPVLVVGVILTFCQVALGGWVSSNYAGISCMGFPACSGQWWPSLNLKEAFDLIHPIGLNYQGGLMDVQARMTVQWVHRLGALCVWVYWLICSTYLWKRISDRMVHRAILALQLCLSLQIILGIVNVVYLLPLPAAVLHNGMGLLVLASSIVLTCLVVGQREYKDV